MFFVGQASRWLRHPETMVRREGIGLLCFHLECWWAFRDSRIRKGNSYLKLMKNKMFLFLFFILFIFLNNRAVWLRPMGPWTLCSAWIRPSARKLGHAMSKVWPRPWGLMTRLWLHKIPCRSDRQELKTKVGENRISPRFLYQFSKSFCLFLPL